jgi:hypothetical protein
MRTRLLVFAALAAGGCMHASDIELHNPILSHAVEPNRIVKDHGYAEQARGLPAGSLADEAILTTADPGQVCFAVTLHELAPIDLQQTVATLEAPKKEPVEQPKIWAETPAMQTFDGLIPEQRETGYTTVCTAHAADGTCTSWSTNPTYSTVYVRGPVNVYSVRGKLCFGNAVLTSATEQITLDLRLARQGGDVATVGLGWGAMGAGTKRIVFRWGFTGGGKS